MLNQNLRESLNETKIHTDQEKQQEQFYIKEMLQLREEVLIRKGFFYFLLPSIIAGIIGAFFPYFFVFLPVHIMGNLCICNYFHELACGESYFLFLKSQDSYFVMQFINLFAVYFTTFGFLLVLIFMIYKIRHINDDTLIKKECAYVIGLWIIIGTIDFLLYLIYQYAVCHSSSE